MALYKYNENTRHILWKNKYLDISFITHNIIAMSYPATGLEASFRHSYKDVLDFLDTNFGPRYKVYNLCNEKNRIYNPSLFHDRVAYYPMKDHYPPSPFSLAEEFCIDVKSWLSVEGNVAVIHCKAGKGRTGVMICCFLMYLNLFHNYKDAIQFYAYRRTTDGNVLHLSRQKLFLKDFNTFVKNGSKLPEEKSDIKQLVIYNVPDSVRSLRVDIRCNSERYLSLVSANIDSRVSFQLNDFSFKGECDLILNHEHNFLATVHLNSSFIKDSHIIKTKYIDFNTALDLKEFENLRIFISSSMVSKLLTL